MKTNPASKSPALRRFFFAVIFCATAAALWATLGNYPPTTVQLSGNTLVTPDAVPTNTTRMNVASSTNFKGRLEGNPVTGVVRVTDAHPAGTHPVTVTGFDSSGIPSTAAFTLTVTTPAACNPVNFTPPANFPVGTSPFSVAIGDFNGDGNQDLASANLNTNNISILLGDGAGSFGVAVNFDAGSGPSSAAVGDFNGDGDQDLAVINANSSNVSILLGNGAGSFGPATNFNVQSNPHIGAVGDFNGDGRQDLAVANTLANNVSVLLGNGAGSFGPAANFSVGSNPHGVVVGDFNGDGSHDVATANRLSNNVSVLLGDGAGSLSTATNFGAGPNPFTVAVGAFNNDGAQDLVVANQGPANTVSVLLGDGAGAFSIPNPFPVGNDPTSVVVGDFDGNGIQDLATANQGSSDVSVVLGNGAGSFGAATNFRAGDGPSALAVGDFTGDGMQDIVTSNFNLNSVSVLLRICPPAFAIDSVTQNEGAPGVPTSFVFTVTKTGITTLTTTVDFMTQDGTATLADNDYEFSSGTLTFASDQPTATVTVIVNGDATAEPDEVFTVHLSNPTNATISTADGTGTITNDDAQPVTPTPTPTATPTATPTPTPTITPPATPTATPTPSPSATASPSASVPPPTSPTPTAPPPAQSINFSTRMRVGTGDNVAIGGFIITGNAPKRVILRAIGPSLRRFGIVDVLADPTLELHGPGGFATITNNNWRDSQESEIAATGIPPTEDLESAIVATLVPGVYTGIVRGNGNTSGIGLVEVYDLNPGSGSKLANISTRAFVGTGTDIVIAGFMLGNGGDDNVIIRGLGPSLAPGSFPPSAVLANPTLELRDSNGTLLVSNDNWQDNPAQAAEITAAGLAPTNDLESAIAVTLAPDRYTALFAGLNCSTGTGIGIVEVYDRGFAGNRTAMPASLPLPNEDCGPTPTPTPTPTPPPAGSCIENFDGVVAPALPAGWVATNAAGSAVLWATSPTTPDTLPNDAFVKDAPEISDKRLDSRNITITSALAQLSFRNYYDLQEAFDGGVLEVSSPNIAGGAFTDILNPAVGGSFVSGAYTHPISLGFGSPIAGRMAWSGDSDGYINTVVNLGPNVNGQTIKLRFRLGTDTALGNAGWRIDTISITGGACP